MLEDMEELFSLENNPGNVPETGSNCFCFPDVKSTIIGARTLPEEKRIGSTKKKEKSLLFDPQKSSGILFEPSTSVITAIRVTFYGSGIHNASTGGCKHIENRSSKNTVG